MPEGGSSNKDAQGNGNPRSGANTAVSRSDSSKAVAPRNPSPGMHSLRAEHGAAESRDEEPAAGNVQSFSPRQRILAAALKLFVEQGYFNTNVPDLSRVSKCSVGSIYHTFKNKEEVATALYEEGIKAFRNALVTALDPKADVADQVKTVVKSFLQFSEVNHQLSKYIWLCRHNEFMTGIIKHPTMVGFDPLGRSLTKAFKQGIRDGKIRKMRANLLWSAVFGIPLAYVRDWLDGYNAEPPSKVAEELSDACWRAIRGQP